MSDPPDLPYPLSDNYLSNRLGLTTREYQRYCVQRLVKVSVLIEDGAIRVTCQFGNRIWEAVVVDGKVSSEQVRFLRGVRSRSPVR